MPQLTTTTNNLHKAEVSSFNVFLKMLKKQEPDDEPIPFSKILDLCDITFAFWYSIAEPRYNKEWRLFSVWCARGFENLMKDEICIKAIDVGERFSYGNATEDELNYWSEMIKNHKEYKSSSFESLLFKLAQATVHSNASGSAWMGFLNATEARDEVFKASIGENTKKSFDVSWSMYTESFRHLVDTGELPPLGAIS